MNKEMSFTGKTWNQGESVVVTIPPVIVEALKLEERTVIAVKIEKI